MPDRILTAETFTVGLHPDFPEMLLVTVSDTEDVDVLAQAYQGHLDWGRTIGREPTEFELQVGAMTSDLPARIRVSMEEASRVEEILGRYAACTVNMGRYFWAQRETGLTDAEQYIAERAIKGVRASVMASELNRRLFSIQEGFDPEIQALFAAVEWDGQLPDVA
jgi:hypothetical protein